MKKALIVSLVCSFNLYGANIIRPDFSAKNIELHIIRAYPDSYDTYALMHRNGRVMSLVCQENPVYEHNKRAFIEYRNYYNEVAGRFYLATNKECRDLAKFIESAHMMIDEERSFHISLNRKKMQVEQIVYPAFDPMTDTGSYADLMPKKIPSVKDYSPSKESSISMGLE